MIVHEIARDLEIEEILWRLGAYAGEYQDLNGAELTGRIQDYATRFSPHRKEVSLKHLCFDFSIKTKPNGWTVRILNGDRTAFAAWCLTMLDHDEIDIGDLIPDFWFDMILDPEDLLTTRGVAALWDRIEIILPFRAAA